MTSGLDKSTWVVIDSQTMFSDTRERMNTVQADSTKLITRDACSAKAQELLLTEGLEQFSMRKVAKALGCAPGTIYLYFTNKSDLLQSVVDRTFERLQHALSGLRERHQNGDPVELLRKGLYTYVDFGLRNPEIYQCAFLMNDCSHDTRRQPELAVEILRGMVARCAYESAFHAGTDVESTTTALWAAAHGITALLLTQPHLGREHHNELVKAVISNALESLVAGVSVKAAAMTA